MDCPVCASPRLRPLATVRRAYLRCGDCGFAWAAPGSRPDEQAALERYALHRNDPGDSLYVAYLSAIVDRALSFAGPSAADVVDWGSGPNPVCASILRERGYRVALWDPAFARDEPPPLSAFDLGLCIEVAEHFLDPLPDFLAFASRLKPGAWAAVHTHFAPERDEDFLRWWYVEDVTHVSFYTEAALRILARKASLATVAMEDGKLAVFRKPLSVLVAGGANMDIEGRPHEKLVPADSNPGSVRFAPGGAARNVAEDLARLGLAVEFVTAIGEDAAGTELADKTAVAGVGTAGFERMEGEATSCYLSVLDADGDMAVAVNGMGIYDRFDGPRALAAAERAAASAEAGSFAAEGTVPFSAVVLDGNLLPATAEALLDRFPGIPVWFDPVSTPKGRRFARYGNGALLGRLAVAKPNLMEAETMAEAVDPSAEKAADTAEKAADTAEKAADTAEKAADTAEKAADTAEKAADTAEKAADTAEKAADTAEKAAEASNGEGKAERASRALRASRAASRLRSADVGVIYVSLGAEGAYRAASDGAYLLRPPAVRAVSATGAGDAFLAGALRARLLGLDSREEGAAGCAAASAALAASDACPADLDGVRLENQISAWRRTGALAWKEVGI